MDWQSLRRTVVDKKHTGQSHVAISNVKQRWKRPEAPLPDELELRVW